MTTRRANLDTSQYVRVTSDPLSPSSVLLQSHRDTVRIAFSEVQPAKSNTVYHELGGEYPPLQLPRVDTAIWALAMTDRSALTVTEQAVEQLPLTSFGELSVAEPTPTVQISAQYGITDEVIQFSVLTGSVYVQDNMFNMSTGTNAFGLATLNSNKHLYYKPGEGALGKFTSMFTSGTSLGLQLAGLINSENSFGFGYLDGDFGILVSKGGVVEQHTLEVTTAAGGAENATITVDDVAYTVPLTAGTTESNAREIVTSLSAQVPAYLFSANDSTVIAMAQVPEPKGVFSFSSATAVATWTQLIAGVSATFICIPQTQWNRNTVSWLDPTKGNVYSVGFKYLGFGNTQFYVEDEKTSQDVLVHQVEYVNKNEEPNVSTPEFRLGWLASNRGNTTDVIVSGASAAGFIEGKDLVDAPNMALENTALSVGSTQTSVIMIRNRFEFNLKVNRSDIIPRLITASTDSTKGAFFRLTIDPDFGSEPNFSYASQTTSTAETSTDAVTVTGGTGRFVSSFIVTSAGLVLDISALNIELLPGQILVLSAAVISGSASDMSASLSWQEDI